MEWSSAGVQNSESLSYQWKMTPGFSAWKIICNLSKRSLNEELESEAREYMDEEYIGKVVHFDVKGSSKSLTFSFIK